MDGRAADVSECKCCKWTELQRIAEGSTNRLPSRRFCVYSCRAQSVSEMSVPLMNVRGTRPSQRKKRRDIRATVLLSLKESNAEWGIWLEGLRLQVGSAEDVRKSESEKRWIWSIYPGDSRPCWIASRQEFNTAFSHMTLDKQCSSRIDFLRISSTFVKVHKKWPPM